jgi:hypothetical protein
MSYTSWRSIDISPRKWLRSDSQPRASATLRKSFQGAFDLPTPDSDDLSNQLLRTVEGVMCAAPKEKEQRFWNIFYDAVAPLLKTPRDAVRLSNAIKVSWPPRSPGAPRTGTAS